eukprot:COSAG01_NODE_5676_length_4104_cov_40.338158_4_plen_103_part_00
MRWSSEYLEAKEKLMEMAPMAKEKLTEKLDEGKMKLQEVAKDMSDNAIDRAQAGVEKIVKITRRVAGHWRVQGIAHPKNTSILTCTAVAGPRARWLIFQQVG